LEEALALLASDEVAGAFLEERIAPAVSAMTLAAAGPAEPERVGPYRLIRELGRGGMGTVYLAQRDDEEYEAQVAVKLVRRGMDTDLILHRFYRERQALARLQHPNIARLLDGGSTPDGRPYIVMEFIDGAKITDYCRDGALTVPQRLRLFLDVLKAIDYAHRHFIVHRDVKPGNILVDRSGGVKLLDFGICKLLHTAGEDEERTREGTPAPMTLDYASPEQVRGEPVTVASDVYSAAAVLYELLAGVKAHRFESYSLRDVEKTVCETDVVPPSAAAGGSLARRLRGDLDNILLCALQKDPKRRYATVDHFAQDIRRHLEHQSVQARPSTFAYRASKFLRRHRGWVAGAAAVLAALSAGLFFSLRSARIANENLTMVRRLSNTFVFDVYDSVRDLPGATRARQLIVGTGLTYLDNLSRNAARDPELQRELASAYRRIGDVQGDVMRANLGDTTGALASYAKAAALLDAFLKDRSSDRDATIERITVSQHIGGVKAYTGDVAGALAVYEAAKNLAGPLVERSPGDFEAAMRLAGAFVSSSNLIRQKGDYSGARGGYARAIEVLSPLENAPGVSPEFLTSLSAAYSGRALCDVRAGRLREALEAQRQSVRTMERLVAAHPTSATFRRELMVKYGHVGDLLGNPNLPNLGDRPGAAEAYRRMTDLARGLREADPVDQRAITDYAVSLTRAAAVIPDSEALRRAGMLRESLRWQAEAARVDPKNASNRADMVFNYYFLGEALLTAGDRPAADRAYRQGLQLAESTPAPSPATLAVAKVFSLRRLGEISAGRGDREAALRYAESAYRLSDPQGPAAQARSVESQRYLTPRGLAAMGLVYATLARGPARRAADAAEARRWLLHARTEYRGLEKHPSFSSTHRRELRTVDEALAKLK